VTVVKRKVLKHKLRVTWESGGCDGFLWVNAICINQVDENSTEKEEQIKLMPDIYRIAKLVCVHLGRATEDSDVAIKFIQQFSDAQIFSFNENKQEMMKKQEFRWRTYDEKNTNALCAIWERPW
jgi:hypothetical protein